MMAALRWIGIELRVGSLLAPGGAASPMRLRTVVAIGAIAFSVWRGFRGMKKNVRHRAKVGLRRVQKAI